MKRFLLALAIVCLPTVASADCFHLPGKPVARTVNFLDKVHPARSVIRGVAQIRPVKRAFALPAKTVRVLFF